MHPRLQEQRSHVCLHLTDRNRPVRQHNGVVDTCLAGISGGRVTVIKHLQFQGMVAVIQYSAFKQQCLFDPDSVVEIHHAGVRTINGYVRHAARRDLVPIQRHLGAGKAECERRQRRAGCCRSRPVLVPAYEPGRIATLVYPTGAEFKLKQSRSHLAVVDRYFGLGRCSGSVCRISCRRRVGSAQKQGQDAGSAAHGGGQNISLHGCEASFATFLYLFFLVSR